MKTEEIAKCINKFVNNYNAKHKDKTIIWYKSRSFRTLKYYNRNFIIARLVYEHGQLLFEYLTDYISGKLSNDEEIAQFSNEIYLNFNKIKVLIENVDIDPLDLINGDNDTSEVLLNEVNENEYFDMFDYFQSFN